MLEQLIYKNHLNEVYEFGKDGIYVDSNDLHDYAWTVTKKNNRISGMEYGVITKKLPVVIFCATEADGIAAKNRLHEVCEKDVLALQHGRIIIGDYYFRCYVTKSQKKNYLTDKRYLEANLTLTSDFPFWVKETTYEFSQDGTDSSGGGQNLDFPFDYAFDYFPGTGYKKLNNPGFVASNFRMIIYGACENPAVYVAGHKYQINSKLGVGEYLTIDSVDKTISKTAADGSTVNLFNLRDRENYVFEKIPSGTNFVFWMGEYGVDITLLEERSEPKWT